MFKKLLFLALSLFSISPAFAHFYKGRVWQGNNTKYIVLADHHRPQKQSNQVAIPQQQDVISWAKRLNAHVIVEDPFTINIDKCKASPLTYRNTEYNSAFSSFFYLNNNSPLINLNSLCRSAGVSVNNIECRPLSLLIPASEFYSQLMKLAKEIQTFNDGPEFNQIYESELREFEAVQKNASTFFELMKNEHTLTVHELIAKLNKYTYEYGHKTESFDLQDPQIQSLDVDQYCKVFQNQDTIQREFNALCRYLYARTPKSKISSDLDGLDILHQMPEGNIVVSLGARLLDSFILHTLINNNQPVKIICAGGAHIDFIEQKFKELKFTKLAKLSAPNVNADEPDAINVNQLLSTQFPGTAKSTTLDTTEKMLALGNVLDKRGLLKKVTFSKVLFSSCLASLIPSFIVGDIASKLVSPEKTIEIGKVKVPARFAVSFVTTYATWIASLVGINQLSKHITTPIPVKQ